MCAKEFLVCRVNPPERFKPKQATAPKSIAQGQQRLVVYAEEIDFYANALGLRTPEMKAIFEQSVLEMSDQEMQQLLDAVQRIKDENP